MPVPKHLAGSATTVRPRRGKGKVHTVTIEQSGETVCGMRTKGWVVAPVERPTCRRCVARLFYPVRPGAPRVRRIVR